MSEAAQAPPPPPRLVHVCDISVRWGDMDALQHVNNAMYLVYLQEARLDWVNTLPAVAMPANSLVATSEITYRRPILWPATLQIEIYCERIGNSSASLSYRLLDTKDLNCLYAECRTVIVWVDSKTQRPTPIPAPIRASLSGE